MSETSESESETNQKKSENRFHQTSKYGNELHPIHLIENSKDLVNQKIDSMEVSTMDCNQDF